MEWGCENNSAAPLVAFLEAWAKDSRSITPEQLAKKPKIEQVVYAACDAFYQRNGRWHADTNYIVIQDSIEVRVLDSDLKHIHIHDYEMRRKF